MRLTPHCFAVPGLAYLPPWPVNAGMVAGRHTTLVIDTGASALSAATVYGYASAVAPANRITVVNTEQHFDHVGGNSYFRNRGAEVYGHALIARTEEELQQERSDYNAAIANPVRRALHEGEVFYRGTVVANPSRPITTDSALDLGECTVEILLTPGHTPTNISAWVPADAVLYCGDCLANGYVANLDFGSPPEWRHWLESLDRIQRLHPRALVPGHGPVALDDEVPRLIDAVRRELQLALKYGVSRTASA
jgi:glyoxylase-like metal-dependent hydrolase (beta-lactamase superfamily II)